ncbi:uncharacterized protein RCC_09650 [Ramularia collo-cygni]|uniref:Cyclin-domain-containing protein n=1 Tax=Ramularia collo-cygni TaxID=112498 RepID=A0A2D3VDS1_9PEZI|nr:uncharacterized protein RCC_09650 [Ramularia collo-cygni]CZT23935.1 uncharacterized protein RCC_09650 [Ramularia collo-cygni]
MSTVLRSPDASPSSFHYATATASASHRPASRSSHIYNSPRRPFNVPVETAPIPITASRPSATGSVAGSAGGSSVGYVDVGTQYSPDGLPPTAGPKLAAGVGKPPGGDAVTTRKRKGSLTVSESVGASESDTSPEPMSGSSASDGAAFQVPGKNTASHMAAAHTPAPAHPELQEARSTHGHSAAPKRARPEPGSLKVMPSKYETCNPKDLGVLIANMLMELIRINDQIPLRDGRLTRFHSRAPPGISVSDYLQRLIQHATLSPPIMLSMVFYIDKLCTDYPAFTVNSLTVHRFLIAAATVAAKGLSDSFWTNPTYARIGGIPVSELATLELELLQRVDYRIVPKPETLEDYYASLVERADGYTLEESSNSGSESDATSDFNKEMKSEDVQSVKVEDEDDIMADTAT